jgi:hemin uptake protein HemP
MRLETERSGAARDQPSTEREGRTHPATVDSRTLFGNAEVLHIDHHGCTYTLRKTRNGKLILTK